MNISGMYSASSAMQAFSEGIHSSAYNVTNIERPTHMQTQYVEGSTGQVQAHTEVVPSSTDYARETVNTIVAQRGHEANTKTIQALDENLGTVINMIA